MIIEEFFFISRENMTAAYELKDIINLPEKAYFHFMNYDEEIIYFLEGEKIKGILSIGDLERYYNDDVCDLQINERYTYLNEINYNVAKKILERENFRNVNEIPVVVDNKLKGIIRYDKSEELRTQQRNALMEAKKSRWHRNEVVRFISRTQAKVLLYAYHVPPMDPAEYEIWRKRQNCKDDSKWKGMSDAEWRTFWQSEYEDGIVDAMRMEMESSVLTSIQTIENGIAVLPDKDGRCYQFKEGYRVTPDNPENADRRIIMFGPCIVLGAYCKDNQTIEAYLQGLLNKDGYISWKVLNRGSFGPQYCYPAMYLEELSENDIVIIWHEEKWLPRKSMDQLILQGDLTGVFAAFSSLTDYFVDSTWHCNYIVNQRLAERIYQDLCLTGALESEKKKSVPKKIQNYYVGWDIWEYFSNYFEKYNLHKDIKNVKTGAIVMNCNPFTKGHRYLIEHALKIVDKLYIFVVEEDSSYFTFRDRFRMVEQGVSDLDGVCVIPSGRYIISLDTFAQYFNKEQVQTVNSMDYDVYIFGEVVAAELGIKYRFVGEEPFDKVTKAYNEAMKRILPGFGIEVVEVPRILFDEKGGIISATLVRKALHEKDMDMVEKLCPKSTVMYLQEHLI